MKSVASSIFKRSNSFRGCSVLVLFILQDNCSGFLCKPNFLMQMDSFKNVPFFLKSANKEKALDSLYIATDRFIF